MKKLTETQLNKIVNVISILAIVFAAGCALAGWLYCETNYPEITTTQSN